MKLHLKKQTLSIIHIKLSCAPSTTFETLLYNLCPVFITVNDFLGKTIF